MINIIKSSYRNTRCAVRSEGALSDWFDIMGVRQGYIWSPFLFGLAIDFVMKTTDDVQNTRLTLISRCIVPGTHEYLPDLDYVDDIALFEENEMSMAKITEVLRQSASKLRLMMSD